MRARTSQRVLVTSGVLLALTSAACRSSEAASAPEGGRASESEPTTTDSSALVPEVAPVYATGEPLQARIPGLDGVALELQQLRGRVAVLAFVNPMTPALVEHLARHRATATRDDVSFVLVATEGATTREFGGLDAWIGRPDIFVGWDPQGALATKLRIERVPTTLVLDRDGRVVRELSQPDEATLADAVALAKQTGGDTGGGAANPTDLVGASQGSAVRQDRGNAPGDPDE